MQNLTCLEKGTGSKRWHQIKEMAWWHHAIPRQTTWLIAKAIDIGKICEAKGRWNTRYKSLEGCSMTIVSYPNLLFLEHHPSHVFANINSTSVMLLFKFGFDTTAASLPECLLLSFGVYKHPRNKAKEKLSLSHRINCSSFLVLLTVNILHFLLFFFIIFCVWSLQLLLPSYFHSHMPSSSRLDSSWIVFFSVWHYGCSLALLLNSLLCVCFYSQDLLPCRNTLKISKP